MTITSVATPTEVTSKQSATFSNQPPTLPCREICTIQGAIRPTIKELTEGKTFEIHSEFLPTHTALGG